MVYRMPIGEDLDTVFDDEVRARENAELMDSYLTFLHIGHIHGVILPSYNAAGQGNPNQVVVKAGFSWHQNGLLYSTDQDIIVDRTNIGSNTQNRSFVYAIANGQGFRLSREYPSYRSTQAGLYFENDRAVAEQENAYYVNLLNNESLMSWKDQ